MDDLSVVELSKPEMTKTNGGLKIPIGISGLILIADAIKAYMEGVEEAYYEKCGCTK